MIKRWMMWPVVAAFAVLAAIPAAAQAPAVDFDQMNFSVKKIVADAKETAKETKVQADEVRIKVRADRDCVAFTFDPEGPLQSETVWLRSTEYREECHWRGDPRRGGHQECHEVPGWTYREQVSVLLQNRKKLYPWEKEVIEVCLDGSWLRAYAVRVGHKYSSARDRGRYTLTAGERIKMDPDRNGISASPPQVRAGGFFVDFKDNWAAYYPGEKVEMTVKFRQDVPNWFDPTLIEQTFTFDVADAYAIDFAKLVGDQLKNGKKYYIEWGFKRLGTVSKDTYMKRGETGSAEYHPAQRLLFVFAR